MSFRFTDAKTTLTQALALGYLSAGLNAPIYISSVSSNKTTPTETRQKRDFDGQIWDGLQAGKIHAAIHKLTEVERTWANVVYGPTLSLKEYQIVAGHLEQEFIKRHFEGAQVRQRALQRFKVLANLAVWEQKNICSNGKTPFTAAYICSNLEVDPVNWKRDWSKRRDSMLKILTEIDGRVLDSIDEVIWDNESKKKQNPELISINHAA